MHTSEVYSLMSFDKCINLCNQLLNQHMEQEVLRDHLPLPAKPFPIFYHYRLPVLDSDKRNYIVHCCLSLASFAQHNVACVSSSVFFNVE